MKMPRLTGVYKRKSIHWTILLVSIAMLALGILGVSASAQAQDAQGQRHVLVGEVDGMINPVTERYISRVISKGEEEGAEVVIIKLNTPGGLLSSTRKIVEDLLSASVPTSVYVFPRGAHAASAGTFITAASNFAAMSPGTNIGAAAPVSSGGEDIPETLKSKVVQDTLALMRSIADVRGRNAEALEDTVTEPSPKSYDAEEAVSLKVVDLVAQNVNDLLLQIDGRTAETASGTRTLNTQGLAVKEVNMSLIEKFLFLLADPNIAFILLTVGGLGIVVELFNPGILVPAIVGIICLLLAFVSLGNLPVNWAAVGFILLAGILLVAEFFVAGFGVLGIGAIVSFIFGGLLLFSSFGGPPSPTMPSFGVSLWVLGSVAGVLTLFIFWFFRTVVTARRAERRGNLRERDPSPLIGATGVVTTNIAPRGIVHVQDEVWTAITEDDTVIESGAHVRVIKVNGNVLTVAPITDHAV